MISLKYKLIHIATLLEVFTPIMTCEVAPAYFSILTSCFLLSHPNPHLTFPNAFSTSLSVPYTQRQSFCSGDTSLLALPTLPQLARGPGAAWGPSGCPLALPGDVPWGRLLCAGLTVSSFAGGLCSGPFFSPSFRSTVSEFSGFQSLVRWLCLGPSFDSEFSH